LLHGKSGESIYYMVVKRVQGEVCVKWNDWNEADAVKQAVTVTVT